MKTIPKGTKTNPEEDAKIADAIKRREAWDKKRAGDTAKYTKILKEGAMKPKSYTIDEMTAATMLKGHPQAQEILDELNKGKKNKNESGEVFQDGSEDTIGSEGHEANLRGVDKVTGSGGNPGVTTKKASMEDGDLDKSDNLTDNLPEEFEDEMETDEERLPDYGKKSLDDSIVDFMKKSWGDELIDKALIGGRNLDPGQVAKVHSEAGGHTGGVKDPEMLKRAAEQKKQMVANAQKRLQGTSSQVKSQEDFDINKSEGDAQMSDWSMEFSKSVLENMGLEKGSPDKSAKIGGQKVRQISYESEPETRVHGKGEGGKPTKEDQKRYVYKKKSDEIQPRKRNAEGKMEDAGKPVSIHDQDKLKNMKSQVVEIYKSLDEIMTSCGIEDENE